jgi:PAS domain S-box-containing protein
MFNKSFKFGTFGRVHFVVSILLIWLLSTSAFAQTKPQVNLSGKNVSRAQAGPATKNVLLLFSGRFIAPLSIAVDEAVRATFQRSPSVKVELYAETLDVARFDPERYGPLLAAYLREKFADRKPDLIITSLPQAPRFLLKFRKELFPDTPIIYCLADVSEMEALTPAPNVTGVPLRIPWKETLDLALGIHPDTRHVVVIAGTDGLARLYLRQSQQVFRPYENRLAVTYLTDLTLPQLLKEVASLPPRTVIIYTTFAVDSAGQVYIDAEVSGIVAKAANAPVYSINNTFMGRGITGGHIIDNGAHATRATEIGLRILAGEKPEAIVVGDVPTPPRFDARQLERWNIAESRLPAGSIVLYKNPSIWKQYRLLILIVGVCLLEALLIVALLVHRRRRRLAEESLRRKTEELDQFFNVSLDLLCIANTDGYFLRLNPAWERTLGYTREELMAKRFLDFVHPDDVDRTRENVSTLASQQKVFSFENRYRCKDGTYRWLEWSSAPAGKLIYAAARDITEHKRTEAEVARAREELLRIERSTRLSELTASLAHELNQPLAAILSNAQAALRFLKSGKPDLNEFQEIMRDIISDDQRAGNVIRSLRSMMKREEGEKRPTILNDILNDVIQIFRSEAIFRNVSIETELDGSLPPVFGDKGQLQQVVLNIIMNGAESMSRNPPEQRKLILRTQRKDHSIGVTVRDFGPGINKENLERIFQPFFTTKGTGLGMGLAVCSSIIRDHRGRIWAENNPDGGATFFIELPIKSNE